MSAAKAPIAVLGAGSWGTALAALLARHGYPTTLWGRDAERVRAIDDRLDTATPGFITNLFHRKAGTTRQIAGRFVWHYQTCLYLTPNILLQYGL